MMGGMRALVPALLAAVCLTAGPVAAQSRTAAPPGRAAGVAALPAGEEPPTRGDALRGEYGRYRSNNDLLSYRLHVRIDPAKKTIAGSNVITFRMLRDDTRIQLDLYANLSVDRILLGRTPLTYTRDLNTVYVDFPEPLRAGREYAIEFFYSGTPLQQGRFGGMVFARDPAGRDWVYTACEDEGAAIWWPNKDQWRDEVEHMEMSVEAPDGLVEVSNGAFAGKEVLGDGYTRWNWRIHYPINNYSVSVNLGAYVHFDGRHGSLPLDYYVLPEDLDKARAQFAQAGPMIEAFEHYFGPYPFPRDGYKLIQVPYSGMEHQSAVTYGNRFANGYLERDWTGVGTSLKFDFIIIHESGHEWFGNAVTAADVSDMWIHEGWTTYLEGLYVEYRFGHEEALRYLNAYKRKVGNREPIITQRGIQRQPSQDMYFKGALFLNTLRSVVDDDDRWWALLREIFETFRYRTILTEDLVRFVNAQLGRDLTPIFDQYLRRAALPELQLADDGAGTLAYRWKAAERGFDMPVKIGTGGAWQTIHPTTDWQLMPAPAKSGDLAVATDLYYIDVGRYTTDRPETGGGR